MKNKIFYPLAAFVIVFLSHLIFFVGRVSQVSIKWVQIENQPLVLSYFQKQEFFIGFSYGLAGAFTVYAILKFFENRKCGLSGITTGITLTSLLYIGGCFLLGCCGSPMLAVYLGLFGSSFLGIAKPLIALITSVSVVIGFIWIEKKSKKDCCAEQQID